MSAEELSECREMPPAAASELESMMGQITPNTSSSRRAQIAGNVCFEMQVR